MDKKSVAILAVCGLLLVVGNQVINKLVPPAPKPVAVAHAVSTNQATLSAATPVPNAAAPASASNLATTASASVATPAVPRVAFDTNAPEQTLTLATADARYVFTSRGGGIKSVELLRYPQSVSALRKKKTDHADPVVLNESANLPLGAWADSSDGIFTLTPFAGGVRAEKVSPDGVRVVKEFSPGSNYVIAVNVRLENTAAAARALPARELVVGTTVPLGARDNGQLIAMMWQGAEKLDETANAMWFANRSLMSCVSGAKPPRTEYRGGTNDVAWAATRNQFFAFAAIPEKPVAEFVTRSIALPAFADAPANAPAPLGYESALVYPALTLAPGQVVTNQLSLYAGPKEYRTLAAVADQFKNNVDLVMGYGGFFGGFARVLLLAMNWLHDFARLPYGWAIIAITVILKTLFWPLTAASTRSMKRMQQFQPQMNAIKDKYKDDPAKMNKKTMEFMKENKINPVGGCLPMLIQIPIFIGFYRMIQSAIELRGAPFLWIGDLAQPDTLFVISGMSWFPFFGVPGVGLPINLLPLIMGATQIWQISLTPPSPGMDPGQQKMMRWMPLMFLGILYNFSAGLTLYWTAQNLLSILQTKLTRTNEPVTTVTVAPAKK
ncbi:MAG: hypothetical protein RLZZ350_1479 [Verrucomicrobiota bacterium]|jgi:YidC/Oxa1 family membrane protein insertase